MSEIPEQMYCSEQICIPPSFPYLLRQYAKAAIRSQPTDLLTWSTAYFRCLSFNIPPPVKIRLEYPLPHNYDGITPGWLKTLTNQFQNNFFLKFKILWDRWMGACLQHNTLIKILCLGQFDQPESIPWIKVMAICAGCLTEDLTRTMILICEILSDEPEGGSAMIPLETFLNIYVFLAKIDTSKDQILKNYYFPDSLLDLFKEKIAKEEEAEKIEEEIAEPSEISESTKSSSKSIIQIEKIDESQKISCPSLPEDDDYSLKYLLKDDTSDLMNQEEEGDEHSDKDLIDIEEQLSGSLKKVEETASKDLDEPEEESRESLDESESKDEADSKKEEVKEQKTAVEEQLDDKEETSEITDVNKEESKISDVSELKPYESVDTIVGENVRDLKKVFEDEEALKEDLARLKALQQEMVGETDDELEKFKCQLIADMPLTESQQEGIKHFESITTSSTNETDPNKSKVIFPDDNDDYNSENLDGVVIEAKDSELYDDVFVEAIPGIGGIVPDEIIDAVSNYMKQCANNQHGMVMPRNIRHYSCY